MLRTTALVVLLLSLAVVPVAQASDSENGGFSQPRRSSGTIVVRAQEGSIAFEGDWQVPTAAPVERRHYLWDADYLDRVRRESYVSTEIGEGRDLGLAAASQERVSRAPARGTTFRGLDRSTSGYQGFTAYPPDANVSVSQTKIIQATNLAVRLTNRAGVELDRQPLNNFFGFDSNSVLFDPKVYFDRLSKRFYVVALEQENTPRRSGIWIAVSKTSDPTRLSAPDQFCTYRMSGKAGASWADYPTIGINEEWFAISVNNFRFNGNTFRRAHVYVMAVDDITDNAGSCPALGVKRFNVRTGPEGDPVFGIHPAQHYSTNNLPGTPLFMVSTAFFLPSSRYTLWQITTDAAGKPLLSEQSVMGDFSYTFAPLAPQRGGSDLDTGDPRITQAAFRKGKIWAVQGTACAIGTLPNESCSRAIQITPTASGTASITFEETFGRANTFLFWPGIAVNQDGDVLVVAQRAKQGAFLRTVYNGKQAEDSSFDALRNLGKGKCTLDNPTESDSLVNRTGDYVGLQADPADNLSFWFTGEETANLGPPFGCDWTTKVARTKYPG